MAELLAAILSLLLHPKAFLGHAVTWHIDNIAAIQWLVKGSSKASDLAHMSMCFHAMLALLKTIAWFEYVASASNPADGGSRWGTADLLAPQLGIHLAHERFPTFLNGIFEKSPAQVLRLWQSRCAM